MLGGEMKTTHQLINEFILNYPITIACTGVFDGANMLPEALHGVFRYAFTCQSQQR